jgi:putative glycosyltransferase
MNIDQSVNSISDAESATRTDTQDKAFVFPRQHRQPDKFTVSVVTSLFDSAPYVGEFYRRILAELQKIDCEYEIVFVDDGSPDRALDLALEIAEGDRKVCVVELSRNFGHHKALMTGLEFAKGDLVFVIDVDLEEPPEVLSLFYERLKQCSADVVYGVQKERRGHWHQRISGEAYYFLYNSLSSNPIPRNQLTARLMKRPYVDALLRYREHLFAIEVLWTLAGFKQVPFPITKSAHKGRTSYTLAKRLRLFVSGITMSSSRPLICIGFLGSFIIALSALYIASTLFQYLFHGQSVDGWTSLIISIWFLGGLIIFSLGIIALYLAVIFKEVKHRPYSIIRRIHMGGRAPADSPVERS